MCTLCHEDFQVVPKAEWGSRFEIVVAWSHPNKQSNTYFDIQIIFKKWI